MEIIGGVGALLDSRKSPKAHTPLLPHAFVCFHPRLTCSNLKLKRTNRLRRTCAGTYCTIEAFLMHNTFSDRNAGPRSIFAITHASKRYSIVCPSTVSKTHARGAFLILHCQRSAAPTKPVKDASTLSGAHEHQFISNNPHPGVLNGTLPNSALVSWLRLFLKLHHCFLLNEDTHETCSAKRFSSVQRERDRERERGVGERERAQCGLISSQLSSRRETDGNSCR